MLLHHPMLVTKIEPKHAHNLTCETPEVQANKSETLAEPQAYLHAALSACTASTTDSAKFFVI